MRLLPALILLIAAPAFAGDLVLRNKEAGVEVRLTQAPCLSPTVLDGVKAEYLPGLHAARATLTTKVIQGCWIEYEDQAVILFENGEQLALPMAAFSDPMV